MPRVHVVHGGIFADQDVAILLQCLELWEVITEER